MINCTKCKCDKDESEFRERPKLNRGYHSWCKECESIANKARYVPTIKTERIIDEEKLKLEAKKRMLKHRYNLTYEDYVKMYEDQNKTCPICEKKFELGGRKGLYVDHCHTTNNVRGLLCTNCNSGIGKLGEDIRIFENAIKYLNRTK